MTNFGWSLPPGCGNVPGDEPLPPCCEECPEEIEANCPGEDNCEIFQKMVRDAAEADRKMCDSMIGVQEPPDDPRIFNRGQKDGTHRPISEFFEPPDDGVDA